MAVTTFTIADLESLLFEAFKQTLRVEKVSRESNFFVCGGDSLSALELGNLLGARLNIDIDLAELPLWEDISVIAEYLKQALLNVRQSNSS